MVELKTRYDRRADVLYVIAEPNGPALARESGDGLLWRTALADGRLVGLTIMDFEAIWHDRIRSLAAQLSARFSMPIAQAEQLLERELH